MVDMTARVGIALGASVFVLLGAAQTPDLAAPQRRVVRVKAERFHFTPSEIPLSLGETIELRIKSDDTAHGFHISGTDVRVSVPKRGQGEASVTFTGSAEGRYEFECDRMCGAGHDFMRGALIVKPATAQGINR
jgi:cytochrome c oxidase subunit II